MQRTSIVLVGLLVAVFVTLPKTAEPAALGERVLVENYHALKAKLEKNQFGAPIYLDSKEGQDSVEVDMFGVFNHPFEAVGDALRSPAHWCDITPLHINIKACTSKNVAGQWFVTMYTGRKYYQPPADAKPLQYRFNVVTQSPRYLQLSLVADQGPLYTKDHRMMLEVAQLDADRTFVHLSYTYKYGSMARMAIKTYFATIARDKVGFSLVSDGAGKYHYIAGVRGSIERNTVRYYLAVETYIDTLNTPQARRFEQRLSRWYDLTSKYPRQLKELEKPEYLAEKRREHDNQLLLQKAAGGLATNAEEGNVSGNFPAAGDRLGTAWCRLATSSAVFSQYAAVRRTAEVQPAQTTVCSLR